jgi:hypothetical protein
LLIWSDVIEPIGLIIYFPDFKAKVAHTGFSGMIRLFNCLSEGDPTPAYSPVSDGIVLAALVDVHCTEHSECKETISRLSKLQHAGELRCRITY